MAPAQADTTKKLKRRRGCIPFGQGPDQIRQSPARHRFGAVLFAREHLAARQPPVRHDALVAADPGRGRWFFSPTKHGLIGLRATHQPSPWMNDYGQFTVMAQTGEFALRPKARASAYRAEDLTGPSALPLRAARAGRRSPGDDADGTVRVFRLHSLSGIRSGLMDAHSQVAIHPERRLITGASGSIPAASPTVCLPLRRGLRSGMVSGSPHSERRPPGKPNQAGR